ncbi:MAG TPA: hypothetical protein VJA20_03115 [Candidatus Nanoarchaeia archaeon]|nr:hypothetical protein [Candidatus Nanoarchaeia archaeon]
MNWVKRLFKRKIGGEELESLMSSLGESDLYKTLTDRQNSPEGYAPMPYARLDVKQKGLNLVFDLYVQGEYYRVPNYSQCRYKSLSGVCREIEIEIPYSQLKERPKLLKFFLF